MAVGGRVFLDTSILLGGLIELGEASLAADRIIAAVARRALGRPLTAWHCCLEFYSVATRLPAGLRLSPDSACRLVEEEVLGRFTVCDLPADGRVTFPAASARERVAGGRIYDAHIGEVARLAGATVVVTDNLRHFTALTRHGIGVSSGAEFVAAHKL